MIDIAVPAPDGAKSLLLIAGTLGKAGVSLEGGGLWSGMAHYLVENGDLAISALSEAGIAGAVKNEVIVVELDADIPGALGKMMAKLVDAEVNLYGQYSDHGNRKVLLVDDKDRAQKAFE